jgi:4-amino-4-deoxy-L-arabinose transferase-like glycosyltransferase
MDDEAFYWAYSCFPAFGYFEHPPLIALFTGAGYWLFKSELGVRFLFVLLNTGSIYITRQLSEGKNDLLFYAIVFSISLTQLGGFIAAPDNILIFFTALFFLIFRRFVIQLTL